MNSYDLLVIGGGINGAAIARDAAGRGLSVLLCERHDLAHGTSSQSSKLIHGGLRYLEQLEFRLVREALAEREVLLANAPHLVRPLRFVLPHAGGALSALYLRAGLFLYDHLGRRRRLEASQGLNLCRDPAGAPLLPGFVRGFAYADCATDDSRLVIANVRDAADRGAAIRTRTPVVEATRRAGRWAVRLAPEGGPEETATARVLVNAAGPWIARTGREVLGRPGAARLRLVKGSHLVFPRLYAGDHAYILRQPDERVVFAIPWLGRYTLVGTTDVPFPGDPDDCRIDPAEADYLCAALGRYFRHAPRPADAVWDFSGVRPLFDDQAASAQAVSRDYVLELETDGDTPLLSVIGGKLTAHRQVAEHALRKLQPFLRGMGRPWTERAPLPGGDIPGGDVAALGARFRAERPGLPESLVARWVDAYGSDAERVADDAATREDLGRDFGGGLTEREVRWLMHREWARTAEDVLWRRTKLGLELSAAQVAALDAWMAGAGE